MEAHVVTNTDRPIFCGSSDMHYVFILLDRAHRPFKNTCTVHNDRKRERKREREREREKERESERARERERERERETLGP
jgi:hypothetical protein